MSEVTYDTEGSSSYGARKAARAKRKKKNREAWERQKLAAKRGEDVIARDASHRTVADIRREAQEQLLRKFLKDGTAELGLTALRNALQDPYSPAHGAAMKMCLERGLPVGAFEDKEVALGGVNITFNVGRVGEILDKIRGNVIDGKADADK